jgi:nitrite reductase/ring-hydroxylating ferredoxin subunit
MSRSLPYPSGWFALASSAELNGDAALPRRLAGQELAVFRTADGTAVVLDAWCPHLGAHLGHGGRVRNGNLVCPFHGFQFGRDGTCVATGYGTKPPRTRVRAHAAFETGGFVFAWYHPDGVEPTWTPPVLSVEGYTPVQSSMVLLGTHPQEAAENSVDLGHFGFVHGYTDMALHHFEVDGPWLHTRYGFTRPAGFPGLGRNLRIEISVHVWGLGFSYVDVEIPAVGLHTRQYVLSTEVAPRSTELRLGMALRRGADADWRLRVIPKPLFDGIVARVSHRSYVGDVMQDRSIWENKRFVDRPLLAEGDGPVGRFRAWCRQFYPSEGQRAVHSTAV